MRCTVAYQGTVDYNSQNKADHDKRKELCLFLQLARRPNRESVLLLDQSRGKVSFGRYNLRRSSSTTKTWTGRDIVALSDCTQDTLSVFQDSTRSTPSGEVSGRTRIWQSHPHLIVQAMGTGGNLPADIILKFYTTSTINTAKSSV